LSQPRQTSLLTGNHVGPHHLIVFVLEHVAVPDIASGVALKPDDDARDGEGIDANGVLPAEFVGREDDECKRSRTEIPGVPDSAPNRMRNDKTTTTTPREPV